MKVAAFYGLTGQGIETAGEILSTLLQAQGYYFRAWRDFSTIIRGGPTAFEIYIAEEGEDVPPRIDSVDVAVVWDDEGAARYLPRLKSDTCLFGSDKTTLVPAENRVEVPTLGFNVFALGIVAGFLGIDFSNIEETVRAKFRTTTNVELAKLGYELGNANSNGLLNGNSSLSYQTVSDFVTLSGNDALSLGAIVGGVRQYFGYPITPASEILENLSKWLPPLGGQAVQVEDEIAAIHAGIGASYAGQRTFVATSGPGLALMTEGISYCATIEIPLVIVDNQRGGPSTGMPTKTEQSDLLHLRYAGHGEFARILLSPTGVLDAITVMQEALNLADYYQCPVILALDLDLAVRRMSVPWSAVENQLSKTPIDRGRTIVERESSTPIANYVRFQSETGIPPLRSIPGIPGGAYVASGDEHDERGWMEPDFKQVRNTLHIRRMHKTDQIDYTRPFSSVGEPRAPIVLFGTGAISELIEETVKRKPNMYRGILIRQLCPVPAAALSAELLGSKMVIVAEYNATAQIRALLAPVFADDTKTNVQSLLRFDGEHYTLEEFQNAVEGLLE